VIAYIVTFIISSEIVQYSFEKRGKGGEEIKAKKLNKIREQRLACMRAAVLIYGRGEYLLQRSLLNDGVVDLLKRPLLALSGGVVGVEAVLVT